MKSYRGKDLTWEALCRDTGVIVVTVCSIPQGNVLVGGIYNTQRIGGGQHE